jgi:hypothetical protein
VDAIQKSVNVALLNDLAAAYLAHSTSDSGIPEDAFLALEAPERAWTLPRTPITAWNRALALERMKLRVAAHSAWTEYLALDPRSRWADEAVDHRNKLTAATAAAEWAEITMQLQAAVGESDRTKLSQFVRRYPQQTREYLEEIVLPDASGARGAVSALRVSAARSLADVLAAHTGDDGGSASASAVARIHSEGTAEENRRLQRGHGVGSIRRVRRTTLVAGPLRFAAQPIADRKLSLLSRRLPCSPRRGRPHPARCEVDEESLCFGRIGVMEHCARVDRRRRSL